MMTCENMYELITGSLDQTNTPAQHQLLSSHLKVCPACRELMGILYGNDLCLRQSVVAPPAGLSTKIMEQVRQNPRKISHKRRHLTALFSGIAVAAVLTIVISVKAFPLGTASAKSMAYNAAPQSMEDKNMDMYAAEVAELPQDDDSYDFANGTMDLLCVTEATPITTACTTIVNESYGSNIPLNPNTPVLLVYDPEYTLAELPNSLFANYSSYEDITSYLMENATATDSFVEWCSNQKNHFSISDKELKAFPYAFPEEYAFELYTCDIGTLDEMEVFASKAEYISAYYPDVWDASSADLCDVVIIH